MSDPGTPADPLDPGARLQALIERGRQSQERIASSRLRVLELMGVSESGPVAVVFDHRGLFAGFTFQQGWRGSGEGAAVVDELNRALLRAATEPGGALTAGVTAPAALAAVRSDDFEPTTVRNAGRTVSVTAVLGSVLRFDVDAAWAERASDVALDAAITEVAREAALASDLMGRFIDSDETEN